jgi:hypothetical protein
MTTVSWLDEEPPATIALAQAGGLFLAGLQRRVTLLIVAAVYAAALAGAVVGTKYAYEPEYVLRVVEPDRRATGMPRPPRQLAEYVRKAVFTNQPLLDVVNRHGLYPSLARRDARAALESFREDIGVEVRDNSFVEERPVGAAPRSARLIVSYRNADPQIAMSVTRELGELVAKQEQTARESQAMRAMGVAKQEVDEARQALAARRSEVASMRSEFDRDATVAPGRRIAFIGLLGSLPALELRVDEGERKEAELALGAALEQRGIGMVFTVVNDALLPTDTGAHRRRALTAVIAFVLGLPLLAMAVGAFGPGSARA